MHEYGQTHPLYSTLYEYEHVRSYLGEWRSSLKNALSGLVLLEVRVQIA